MFTSFEQAFTKSRGFMKNFEILEWSIVKRFIDAPDRSLIPIIR